MTQRSAEAEKRQHVRYALTGEIPGALTSERGETFEVVSVDVSLHGLGLLLEPAPEVGETLTLAFRGAEALVLRFEVRWCTTNHSFDDIAGLRDMRRCGLRLLTRGVNLLDLFAKLDGVTIEE